VRVLAADDSQVMRRMFQALFDPQAAHGVSGMPEMELCGVARDGVECLDAVKALAPDVLLLDLEMPRLHGLEVLARLRVEAPMLPTIMCSTYTERGARATLDGLARGAADYVAKPSGFGDSPGAVRALAEELLPKIAALAGWSFMGAEKKMQPARMHLLPPMPVSGMQERDGLQVVAIGVSTGGPSALEQMLPRLPKSFPVPVLIVQHMPKLFTSALADRLDRCCALRVREAFDGVPVAAGTIWIAPGDAHMEVVEAPFGRNSVIRLWDGEPLNHYKPAVDYLFASVAKRYGAGGLAVVMTGMGSDGLAGARKVHAAGGTVLVQDEATSAVWGMPARVAGAGIAAATLPLGRIAGELVRRVGSAGGMHLVKGAAASREAGLSHGVLRGTRGNDGLL
jgi:two-component system chemotaxis response regulator CheB